MQNESDAKQIREEILKKVELYYEKKYKKVEFFHVSRDNRYIQKCDKLCNSRLDEKGLN